MNGDMYEECNYIEYLKERDESKEVFKLVMEVVKRINVCYDTEKRIELIEEYNSKKDAYNNAFKYNQKHGYWYEY